MFQRPMLQPVKALLSSTGDTTLKQPGPGEVTIWASMSRRSSPRASRRGATSPKGLLPLAFLVAAALTWLPWISWLAYPFRLLVTLVHELSHGLAALATGGYFRNFVVFSDGSGLAYTAGGWRWVVVPAGYLGAAAFGALLILLGTSLRASRWALGGLGVLMALLSLRYGLPSLASEHALAGLLAATTGTLLGGIFLTLALRASGSWILFTIHLLALMTGLNAFSDLRTLIGLSASPTVLATDARSMADLTHLPAAFWAVFWAFGAGLLLGSAAWIAWSSRRRL